MNCARPMATRLTTLTHKLESFFIAAEIALYKSNYGTVFWASVCHLKVSCMPTLITGLP